MYRIIRRVITSFLFRDDDNEGVTNKDLNNILMWGGIMIGLALFSFICGIFNSFYASHTSTAFAYDIRKNFSIRSKHFHL